MQRKGEIQVEGDEASGRLFGGLDDTIGRATDAALAGSVSSLPESGYSCTLRYPWPYEYQPRRVWVFSL